MANSNVVNQYGIIRTFDRRPFLDPRSRAFRAVDTIGHNKLRSYTWSCGQWNDQGQEGACVGFAFSHELTARPAVVPVDANGAREVYKLAQTLDPWEGEDYDGTSVLAGVKAVQRLYPGKLDGYRWAFGLEDVVRVLGYRGPVVLGVNWYMGMFEPGGDGWIGPYGEWVGGHALLARGVKLVKNFERMPMEWVNVDLDRSYVLLRNSWGRGWGMDGDAKISLRDLDILLKQDGEACVPMKRGR